MTTTVSTDAPSPAAVATGPDATEAFVADRQAFWGSFTSAVTMAAAGLGLLLLLLAFFLT